MFVHPYADRDSVRFFQPEVSSRGLEKWRRQDAFPNPVAVVDPRLQAYIVLDGTHRSFIELREREEHGMILDVCVTLEDITRYAPSNGVCGRVQYEAEQFLRKSSENPHYYRKFPLVDGLRINES